MKSLFVDLETYSGTDLSKSGVYRYSEAQDFEILLFGYSADGGEVRVIDLASGEALPPGIIEALTDESVIKWAHNAQFERVCLSRYLAKWLQADSWRCTMVWAAYMGLPLSLEGAAVVAGADKQKLKEGKELIRYFCQPCKPTKANGGRTCNLPEHAPEKWEQFKAYNARDVETEMAIHTRLEKFAVPGYEWENYILDQQINDRGIMLDMTLVRQAIRCDERSRSELTGAIKKLTDLENPNSVIQMKSWLAENGLEMDTLGKAAVKETLKTAPDELGKVLELRQSLAKSSVKKYTAMENAVCKDGRARGLLQFYGANRTGRFSGRLIQIQNLPQNHMPDLEQARNLVHSGNFEALDILYDSVPSVLSELIRTAFIPKPGCKFIVDDFSAIEARVIAWFAGETWKMNVFAGDGKIYEATAARMFHVPIESVTKGSDLRQKAKQTELACIAEGEMVLTDKGLVPIEDVTIQHRLWDGENWVSHEGVIFKGERKVIEYEGLRATPDHFVWVEGKQKPVRFEIAAACGTHLVQTGNGRKAVWLGDCNKSGKTMEQSHESLLCLNSMQRMRMCLMAESKQSERRKIKRMSKLLKAKANTILAGQETHGCETTLRKSECPRISQLRRERHSMEVFINTSSRPMDTEKLFECIPRSGNRSYRQQQGLQTRKYPAGATHRKSMQQADSSIDPLGTKVLAVCTKRCNKEALGRAEQKRSNSRRGKSSFREKEELAYDTGKVRVYDIRNAGRYHRFTVSGKLVHNCGYGGSVGALKAMGALEMGIAEEELRPLVNAWRKANPNIVRFWWEVDRAVKKAVKERTATQTHKIRFEYLSGMLFIQLPSGRRLAYVKPKIIENCYGTESVTYEGVGATKKWERIESYGPKFVENIVQATARDLLTDAMQRIDKAGYRIVMHCHDEVVVEAPAEASLEKLSELMSQTPEWAEGLLLRADGYVCDFYKKE